MPSSATLVKEYPCHLYAAFLFYKSSNLEHLVGTPLIALADRKRHASVAFL